MLKEREYTDFIRGSPGTQEGISAVPLTASEQTAKSGYETLAQPLAAAGRSGPP